jgi:MFS superfamily sulfate permease-like transporter
MISSAYSVIIVTDAYIPLRRRLGWLIRFISHSVISGFTTASAIVIALSQAKYFLGYDVVRSSKIVPLIKSIISGAHKVGLFKRREK